VVGDRGQVQQCNSHHNQGLGIIAIGDNCLITMNTANLNDSEGIRINGNKCTVSYNTASNNQDVGIRTILGSGHLVTHNVALNNAFSIVCPSTVTYNDSTNGFPASYNLVGPGCHTANND
jgi:parallel beta-helix repeat protein